MDKVVRLAERPLGELKKKGFIHKQINKINKKRGFMHSRKAIVIFFFFFLHRNKEKSKLFWLNDRLIYESSLN